MSSHSALLTGRLVADTLWTPTRGLGEVAARKSVVPALLVTTIAALLNAAVMTTRLDTSAAVEQQLERSGAAASMTPHEREEKLESARKIGVVGAYAGAALMPSLTALAIAVALWLAFAVASKRPSFGATFAVAAYGQLPLAVKSLAVIPALLARDAVLVWEVPRLLPSHLGTLLGPGRPGPLAALLASVDLFSLWAVALTAIGMHAVSGVSRTRAAVVTVVMWASYVAVFQVSLASSMGAR